jgi:deazaflavin-dependent oxidoreductase (nitroreductase family)
VNSNRPEFQKPGAAARLFNNLYRFFVGLGSGPKDSYLLQVRGRKSGRVYSMPVHLLRFKGKEFLVAPRGPTQWVRNAQASGEMALKRGTTRREFRLRAVQDEERPQILKAYLDTFTSTVQRYFPMPAGSPVKAFEAVSVYYPLFELRSR